MLIQSLVSITWIPLFVFVFKKFMQLCIGTFNILIINVETYYKSKLENQFQVTQNQFWEPILKILFLCTKFIGQGLIREAGRHIMVCEQ